MPFGPDSIRQQRMLALASTFSDVLTVIPTSYREPSRTFLKELWESSKKMANARVSLEHYLSNTSLSSPTELRSLRSRRP
jgi:hypothetical protein